MITIDELRHALRTRTPIYSTRFTNDLTGRPLEAMVQYDGSYTNLDLHDWCVRIRWEMSGTLEYVTPNVAHAFAPTEARALMEAC